jgi:hypothetical protein
LELGGAYPRGGGDSESHSRTNLSKKTILIALSICHRGPRLFRSTIYLKARSKFTNDVLYSFVIIRVERGERRDLSQGAVQ